MKRSNDKSQTFRDKLHASVAPDQRDKVDALVKSSIRGSDRIEGIQRSRNSYEAANPRDLRRVPRDQR